MSGPMYALRVVSALLLVVSVISIGTGIAGLCFSRDHLEYPGNTGLGIATGVMTIALGCVGLAVCKEFSTSDKEANTNSKLLLAHSILSGFSIAIAIQDIIHSGTAVSGCATPKPYCQENTLGVIAMATANTFIGFFLLVLAICSTTLNTIHRKCGKGSVTCCGGSKSKSVPA